MRNLKSYSEVNESIGNLIPYSILTESTDIKFDPEKHVYDAKTKTFMMSEVDVPKFDTEYVILNSKTGGSKAFKFDRSTGPEFDPKTAWVYKSSDGLTLEIHNDAKVTKARAKVYLNHKLRREPVNEALAMETSWKVVKVGDQMKIGPVRMKNGNSSVSWSGETLVQVEKIEDGQVTVRRVRADFSLMTSHRPGDPGGFAWMQFPVEAGPKIIGHWIRPDKESTTTQNFDSKHTFDGQIHDNSDADDQDDIQAMRKMFGRKLQEGTHHVVTSKELATKATNSKEFQELFADIDSAGFEVVAVGNVGERPYTKRKIVLLKKR